MTAEPTPGTGRITEDLLPWPPQRAGDIAARYLPHWGDARVVRVSLADGRTSWLATGHAEVRSVLSGRHFAVRASPLHRNDDAAVIRASRILRLDGAEHRRVRSAVAKALDGRRHTFRPLTEAAVERHLDLVRHRGGPVDLVAGFALAVPLQVVSELLGLPSRDRERFYDNGTAELMRIGISAGNANERAQAALDYLAEVVDARYRVPQDDLISDLVTGSELTAEEIAEQGVALLMAGYEAPAGMISKGAVELAADAELRAALTGDDPGLRAGAVEELLRHVTIVQYGIDRVATEDVMLGGRRIRRGESVIALLAAANHDPALSAAPEKMNAHCPVRGHVAFGHGPHHCLGPELSRIMVETSLSRLFTEFPALRVVENDNRERDEYVMGGHLRLWVTW
ncbi:cytochrome P450 [Nocardia sp. NRRL S-836]|uniref:cytochrome P450 n=1 Tax=Nocardia sp. NRRL S-836 TaxID=1519492 RepID=UPI0006AE314F|nr:cytochrome P450 [Nocardia sp. NRRL S-836]